MNVKAAQWIAFAADWFLRPLGLMLWITYEGEEDERGLPVLKTMRAVSFKIDKRIKL